MGEGLRCEVEDGVARITLDRPDKLNALDPDLLQGLRKTVDALGEQGGVRCLWIRGAGRAFCSGADLTGSELPVDASGAVDLGLSLERDFNPVVRALSQAPFPTLAAVHGPCVGAGMSLALACDLVLAARSAFFSQAFCRVGLVPDAGSTWFLPRMVGSARAAALALLGGRLSAEEAVEWGLVWRCVDDEALLGEAREVARDLARRPTRTLVLCRQALRAASGNDLDRQLDLERDLQREAGLTRDAREGLRAFAEKRDPDFRGC